MFQSYPLLPTHTLHKHTPFYHPERQNDVVNLESPAKLVFTDFKSKSPETIRPQATLDEALNHMIVTHVKSLLVVDESEDVVGLISTKHIYSPEVPKIAKEHGVGARELSVSTMMMPLEKIITIDLNDLKNARVGHIAKLLHDLALSHLLVIETTPDTAKQVVRGILSASRISRQLGVPILNDMASNNLADMNALKG